MLPEALCRRKHMESLLRPGQESFQLISALFLVMRMDGQAVPKIAKLLADCGVKNLRTAEETTYHTMAQQLIPFLASERFAFPMKFGPYGIDPHLGIPRVFLEHGSEVIHVLIVQIKQRLSQGCRPCT
jgi:hypothetical protein